MSMAKTVGRVIGAVVVVAILGWASTAPYLSNQGLGRLPGIIMGGTATEPLADFGVLNGQVQGPLMMKFTGFPPFVNYLSWVGEGNGFITATRPDGGLWAKRAREDGGDGWLRIGDSTFAMRTTEITDPNERLRMMERWASKAGRTLDEPLYEGSEPLREWKVFFWTPR